MKFKNLIFSEKPIKKIIIIFSIAFTFIFSSCERDLYEDNLNTSSKKLIIKSINLNTYNKMPQDLMSFQNKMQKRKLNRENNKMVFDSINDFYVDEENTKYIQAGDKESYTVSIKKENVAEIENLLFNKREDGQYDIFLAKYEYTPEELKLFTLSEISQTKTKFYPVEFDENGLMSYKGAMGGWTCYDVYSIETEYSTMNLVSWQGWTLFSSICDYDYDEGMGGGSGGNGGYGNTSPSHGASSGTATSPNNNTNTTGGVYGNGGLDGTGIITIPIAPKKTPKEIKLAFTAFLADSLHPHPNELAWWNALANGSIVKEIVDYLTANQTYAVEDQTPSDFALECINQIIQNPTIFTSFKPFVIEKQIDDSQLDPCNKNIMNQLKNLQQADIAKIFAKLNNPNMVVKPYYSTKIVNANPTNPDAYASTNWVAISNPSGPQPGIGVQSPFNYVINVRPAYLDGTMLTSSLPPKKPTQLSIARTLLHEIIHAYFDSLFDDCHYYNNCSTIKDFSELWSDYEHFQLGTTNPVTDPQHLAIANNFVNILACALQEFQTGISVTNASQDFKDLAWFGLQGNILNPNNSLNPIFNLEYPLGSNKRIRFEAVNTAEDFQQSSYNIVPNIHPKSIPCN